MGTSVYPANVPQPDPHFGWKCTCLCLTAIFVLYVLARNSFFDIMASCFSRTLMLTHKDAPRYPHLKSKIFCPGVDYFFINGHISKCTFCWQPKILIQIRKDVHVSSIILYAALCIQIWYIANLKIIYVPDCVCPWPIF